jgi:hypothetical protein
LDNKRVGTDEVGIVEGRGRVGGDTARGLAGLAGAGELVAKVCDTVESRSKRDNNRPLCVAGVERGGSGADDDGIAVGEVKRVGTADNLKAGVGAFKPNSTSEDVDFVGSVECSSNVGWERVVRVGRGTVESNCESLVKIVPAVVVGAE